MLIRPVSYGPFLPIDLTDRMLNIPLSTEIRYCNE